MIEKVQTRIKDNITKEIGWITIGSLVLLSVFLNFSAYYSASNHQKIDVLFRNISISMVVIAIMAILLKHYLNRVTQIMIAKKKAEHTALIKAKFLSTMSHEIRTPMNAVIGLTNILQQEKTTA